MTSFFIHVSKTLGFGPGYKWIREELRGIFREELVYIKGPRPPGDLEKVDALSRTFLSGDTVREVLIRLILKTQFTGDPHSWRIAHYCTGCCNAARNALTARCCCAKWSETNIKLRLA